MNDCYEQINDCNEQIKSITTLRSLRNPKQFFEYKWLEWTNKWLEGAHKWLEGTNK